MNGARKRFTRVHDFYILETLGVGAFAKVRLAIHCVTQEPYACKILDKSFIRQREQNRQVRNEIDALERLNHPNIVRLVDVINTSKRVYIIMELVSGGELFDVITKQRRLTEPQARFYFHQLVEGLHYCHKRGVFHRDLKLENILLSTTGVLKITDFGLSQLLVGPFDGTESFNSTVLFSTQCGSPYYIAPEVVVVKGKGYSGAKADAWACGIILYVLAAGCLPFQAFLNSGNNAFMFHLVVKGGMNYPESFSEELKDLIGHLLELDPDHRYAMPAIMKHPWFNGPCQDPGRHRSDIIKSQVPQIVAARLGSVPINASQATRPPEANDTVPDAVMETDDSLNLGKRVDSFEGTAPAALLPMASGYSDAYETDATLNEFRQEENYLLRATEVQAATIAENQLAEAYIAQHGLPVTYSSQDPSLPPYAVEVPQCPVPPQTYAVEQRQFDTGNTQVAYYYDPGLPYTAPVHQNVETAKAAPKPNIDLPSYDADDSIVHNWNVLPSDYEVGEHTHLLSLDTSAVQNDDDQLRRVRSVGDMKSQKGKRGAQIRRTRSAPAMKPYSKFPTNARPFRLLSLESKRGTVRLQLWELSINQWRSECVPISDEQRTQKVREISASVKAKGDKVDEPRSACKPRRSSSGQVVRFDLEPTDHGVHGYDSQIPRDGKPDETRDLRQREKKKSHVRWSNEENTCAVSNPEDPDTVDRKRDKEMNGRKSWVSHCRSNDYQLVDNYVEFGLPADELARAWDRIDLFDDTEKDSLGPIRALISSTRYSSQNTAPSNGATHVRPSGASASTFSPGEGDVTAHISDQCHSDDIIRAGGSKQSVGSPHNGSSSTPQRSVMDSTRSEEIEPGRAPVVVGRTPSGRYILKSSSRCSARRARGATRFLSGNSVDTAFHDLSADLAPDPRWVAGSAPVYPNNSERIPIQINEDVENSHLLADPSQYELPGPQTEFPSFNPFISLLPRGMTYKNLLAMFKSRLRPREDTQFRTLIEPNECKSILEDVLRECRCTNIKCTKKSKDRFRVKCNFKTKEENSAMIMTVARLDDGLSSVQFTSTGGGNRSDLQAFYRLVTKNFHERKSWNAVTSNREDHDEQN
ncbi:CBL-interacting protein kinase 31 [Gracilariopsis chorda]|uniref:non-specific serine/threonine protein kinase n=1 Tax=Gracilariopsis chorda TaxID=448386 RepID=A0A2V3JBC4_9FLOR|nr:CBL-interacting protein kinase 31 [Gracilariopsis chorda]|eukprot:PXF49810.1 CBL-interacting protein kinase 31 [Gracilariopsis chorda]